MTPVQTPLSLETQQFIRDSGRAVALARENGIITDMTEWLTIKRYVGKYNVTTQVVTNWISRGVIPADCTTVLPELNDIRLVKDRKYK